MEALFSVPISLSATSHPFHVHQLSSHVTPFLRSTFSPQEVPRAPVAYVTKPCVLTLQAKADDHVDFTYDYLTTGRDPVHSALHLFVCLVKKTGFWSALERGRPSFPSTACRAHARSRIHKSYTHTHTTARTTQMALVVDAIVGILRRHGAHHINTPLLTPHTEKVRITPHSAHRIFRVDKRRRGRVSARFQRHSRSGRTVVPFHSSRTVCLVVVSCSTDCLLRYAFAFDVHLRSMCLCALVAVHADCPFCSLRRAQVTRTSAEQNAEEVGG